MAQPRIQPLSAKAISQIHSSKHITSLQGVIWSLLENSLDGGATKVEITVDWKRGGCTVDDNGAGIPAGEFSENGGLCRMYCTSKRAPTGNSASKAGETHGSTGTFLSELSAMSMLTITSTYTNSTDSGSLTIHQGKVLARQARDIDDFRTSNCGTNVTVRDLFGNMPVRVKQRAITSLNGVDGEKSWNELKHGIVALLLAWPQPCSVRLRETDDSSHSMYVSAQSSAFSSLTRRNLNQLGSSAPKYDVRDTLPVLVQSGLATPPSSSRWIPLSASTSAVSLKGLVCLDPVPSKQCQFIALGVSPCGAHAGQNELYEVVNKAFYNSSFGMSEERSFEDSPRLKGSHPMTGLTSRKSLDRYPMFCLQLQLKSVGQVSSKLDRLNDRSLNTITDVLEAASVAWLERNHFRPSKRSRTLNNKQITPVARSYNSSTTKSPPGVSRARAAENYPAEQAEDEHDADAMGLQDRGASLHSSSRPASRAVVTVGPEQDLLRLSRIRGGNHRQPTRTTQTPISAEKQTATGTTTIRKPAESLPGEQDTLLKGDVPNIPHAAESHSWDTILASCADLTRRSVSDPFEKQSRTNDAALPSEDFGSLDDVEMLAAETTQDISADSRTTAQGSGEDGVMSWTDPVNGQMYRVNCRTGVVLPFTSEQRDMSDLSRTSRSRAGIDISLSSAGKPLSLDRRKALGADENVQQPAQEKWLQGFLREWKNPVFAAQVEEPIPMASAEGPGVLEVDEDGIVRLHTQLRAGIPSSTEIKLSKAALKHAKTVGQVDQKFVLCKIPDLPARGEILILIDQHAASERVILESLFDQLCIQDSKGNTSIATTCLATNTAKGRSVVFEISAQEYGLFQQYRRHFLAWGIVYDLTSSSVEGSKTARRLIVRFLPSVIAERCANFPALCIELMRTEVWELADGTKRSILSLPESSSWLSLLPLLPAGLKNMLHSRSCRSAIMFNDPLPIEQCQDLVEKLSHCTFPFVCAHGRVAMVPLVAVGEHDRLGRSEGLRRESQDVTCGNAERDSVCSAGSLMSWLNRSYVEKAEDSGTRS
ncbi:DNA mismatch repair MLH3 [Lecanosticta acicola]|uniref:DNA mismatch repair MLH3 n=1 Tax=Lecanosticta acicola TaxID=111012 RepID=A0AAI8YZT7_9PEZI|nr:DNA mismatch repair MLH3 [Lecanosticta acicola]